MPTFSHSNLCTFPCWLGLECPLKYRAPSHMLLLLFLTATGTGATCYRPGGFAADPRYVPCNAGTPSMCCRLDDSNNPDFCRGEGLCQETQQDVVWRESCTDPTWQAPECLRLCIGERTAALSSRSIQRLVSKTERDRWCWIWQRQPAYFVLGQQYLLRVDEYNVLYAGARCVHI
jgi:hypothetical protein